MKYFPWGLNLTQNDSLFYHPYFCLFKIKWHGKWKAPQMYQCSKDWPFASFILFFFFLTKQRSLCVLDCESTQIAWFLEIFAFIYFKRDRAISYLLGNSPDASNSLCWDQWKLQHQSSFQVSHRGSRNPSIWASTCIIRQLESGTDSNPGTLTRNTYIPSSGLTMEPNVHSCLLINYTLALLYQHIYPF